MPSSENHQDCREVWAHAPNGSSLYALINGNVGWLMFLRTREDSSRNPAYVGPPDATIAYKLSNGQVDSYPASWALPIATVDQALLFFRNEGRAPPFISWHNDANDGSHISAQA